MRRAKDQAPAADAVPAANTVQDAAERFAADLADGRLQDSPELGQDELAELQRVQEAASAEAVRLAREHTRQAEDRRKEFLEAMKQGRKLPPVRTSPTHTADDPTLPVDPADGKIAGNAGYVKKWVRLTDSAENESGHQVGRYGRMGFTPVLSRGDQKPITAMSHMLMEAPPAADAARRAAAMEGRVTASKDASEKYHQSIEETNRAFGYEAVQPFAQEGHGERRRFGTVVPPE